MIKFRYCLQILLIRLTWHSMWKLKLDMICQLTKSGFSNYCSCPQNHLMTFISPLFTKVHFNKIPHLTVLSFYSTVELVCLDRSIVRAMSCESGFDSQQVRFFSFPQYPDQLWGPISLLSNGYKGLSGWGVMLTTHLYLVPRSRMVNLYLHSPIF
jgi:hypothetical protein